MRIGIPRALSYYQYFPMWKTFFERLGVEVIVSPPTTRDMLMSGCSRLIAETCLPVKVYCGHVLSLVDKCDYVFIPSIRSLEPKVYNCPKFIGLPDVIRLAVPECPPILDPDIDISDGKRNLYQAIYKLGCRFSLNPLKIKKASEAAWRVHQEFQTQMQSQGLTAPEAISRMFPQTGEEPKGNGFNPTITIALIGHPYLLYDEHINHQLAPRLREMGAKILFPGMVEKGELRAAIYQLVERPYWTCEDEIIGAGVYYLRGDVDGVISVAPFGCGPDSLMIALLQRYAKQLGKPFMSLTFDEHTTETGLITRLEAFIDMVQRRKKTGSRYVHTPNFVRKGREQEKISVLGIPNLGDKFAAFRKIVQELDIRLVVPPVTRHTLSLGTRYSPEFVCLPFKGILGTFIECLEQGADTLFMVTSFNACRMGYYAKVQEQILHDLGYDFKFLKFHSSEKGLIGVLRAIKRLSNNASWATVISVFRLGVAKLRALDELERRVQKLRPLELEKGITDCFYQKAIEVINRTTTLSSLKQVVQGCIETLEQIPRGTEAMPIKIGIVGEMYVVMEPFSNMNLEFELGKMGVEVSRTRSTFFSEWTKFSHFLNALNEEKKELREFAQPYLKRDVGGHGLETVGEKVRRVRDYDGIIHLAPLTCMPEVIARNIMPFTKENIPVLTIVCDELMGKAGVLTRVEAFVDLLKRRRNQRLSDRILR
ncbi:MAG: acyl-CoA dehydratase activase-related protein [Dehalococcoidales bacterium]|nr:acyl-CoA dehydratase activase-related protein [Dehalococcoidales bacterium]